MLDFDYNDKTGEYEACYKGLTIKAVQDSHASNPWETYDGNVPLVVSYGRDGLREYGREAGFPLLKPFSSEGISDSLLRRHMAAICKVFDGFGVYKSFVGNRIASVSDWLANESAGFPLLKPFSKDRKQKGDCLTYIKRELLQECLDGMRDSDRLSALCDIYQAIGWPALYAVSRGYSQGDYAELLLVVTQGFRKAMNMESRRIYPQSFWASDMESAVQLYSAWAWGDVYGYVIASDDDSHMDSCWGYYGTDFDQSGLAESAINAADCLLAAANEKRLACLAQLIKNRVPLDKRPALLAQAGEIRAC